MKNRGLKARVIKAVKLGRSPNLRKSDVRKLMLELKSENPDAYKKVKKLNFNQQRKLFIGPILNALGLGDLANTLGPLGTSGLGLGLIGAGVGAGAIGGRISQSMEISYLQKEKDKINSQLMMIENQAVSEKSKLEAKIGDLEGQLRDLNESSESGVNDLNLWVDSHYLV
jgi:hypothetical protein